MRSAGFRSSHLTPFKRALYEFDQDDANSLSIFRTIIFRIHEAFVYQSENNTSGFVEAAARDPDFVQALLQISRQDDFFLFEEDWDPFLWRLRLLEEVVHILVELSRIQAAEETATAALIEIVQWHERLSGAFLLAANRLEELVDCSAYNICRDVLEEELYERALPNTYQLNNDLVIETSMDISDVARFAQGARYIKSRLHRLTETDQDVKTGFNTFRVRAYGSFQDYYEVERYLFPWIDTRGIHSGGHYGDGAMAAYRSDNESTNGEVIGELERTFLHEYGHYLADRHGLLAFVPWFDEGLAEFLHTSAAGLVSDPTSIQLSHVFDFTSYSAAAAQGPFTLGALYK